MQTASKPVRDLLPGDRLADTARPWEVVKNERLGETWRKIRCCDVRGNETELVRPSDENVTVWQGRDR